METKLPYYMVYPMPFIYDDERLDRRDYEYMRSLYPDTAKRVLPYVEEECDRCEGPNSMIYDEYPDRVGLGRLCDQVYRQEIAGDADEKEAEWTRAAVEVLLYHEICRRRVRRRGLKRKYW